MKYTKALAFVAVAIMLAVPIGALFADADVSADAEKKNKTVNGEKAIYAKTDKELNREKMLELLDLYVLEYIMYGAIGSTGLNTDLFLDELVVPDVVSFKLTSLEFGDGSKVADDTSTGTTVMKVKGEYDLKYKFAVDLSYKMFMEDMGSKTGDVNDAFKAYFGETVKAGTEIELSAKFETNMSSSDVVKYVNISTGELVLSMHKLISNEVAKIDDGKLKIGDKTMTFSVNISQFYTRGFDYSIGSGAKLDDKVDKASIIWDLSGSASGKYKFGDKEVSVAPDSKEYFEEQNAYKERLEPAIKDAKEKKISEADDLLRTVKGVASIVQNADVKTADISWTGYAMDEQKLKDNGFTTSTDKMGDVQSAADSIASSSGKSPVLFIVIAVVAVVVVAGVVFVVMKKKSA